MRIIVRSEETNLWLPVPLSLASAAVSLLPEAAFEDMRKSLPPAFRDMVTKDVLRMIVKECRSILKQYKGLEVIHVEARDGTFISIRL
ncbi:hypothetical protein [Anaerolentibacter hominis]|uniref:hypothetical protein n=1 Tax=Anaerolentibacter hominis TaxID=3079009 RepID=UPI0031B89F2D